MARIPHVDAARTAFLSEPHDATSLTGPPVAAGSSLPRIVIAPHTIASRRDSHSEGMSGQLLGAIAYIGALAWLLVASARGAWEAGLTAHAMRSAVASELSGMIGLSLPLVGLSSIAFGSFLAMQSYFGGTFVDGTGAVVGVGLVRYLGPVIAGLALSGLSAARILADHGEWDEEAEGLKPANEYPRIAARLVAGALCGFVMSAWACTAGIVAGWWLASRLVGVSNHTFGSMFLDMLWVRDVIGLPVKGGLFGGIACWVASHESLRLRNATRERGRPSLESVSIAACRSASISMLSILLISAAWFLLLYHAGLPFGPTLMKPPNS
jgi:phospholipid/cholesterol/gamma-HCH transport system permease protein